jgi:hypothetical protein
VIAPLFVLGGAQTDFARNFAREGTSLFDVMRATTAAALEDAGLAWADVETVHVGNFTAELFAHQGQLGGFFPSMHEDPGGRAQRAPRGRVRVRQRGPPWRPAPSCKRGTTTWRWCWVWSRCAT